MKEISPTTRYKAVRGLYATAAEYAIKNFPFNDEVL